jgi:hypothetical protein
MYYYEVGRPNPPDAWRLAPDVVVEIVTILDLLLQARAETVAVREQFNKEVLESLSGLV